MSQTSDNASPLEEQLVAYLDGELDEASARRVEELLATDPEARQTLHQLERAWQLLDELQGEEAPPQFTRTTLEMVTVEAARQFELSRARRMWRTWGRRIVFGAALVAAGLAGFLAVALVGGNADRRLLEDLPLLESLPEYREIDSLDLLRSLYREGLFADDELPADETPQPPPSTLGGEPEDEHHLLEQCRRRIEAMDPAQQELLRRRREELASLAPAEQQRLRRLSEVLAADPERAELEAVMHRYCRWLDELPAYRRAELAELELDQRIDRIKQLRAEERQQRAREAGPEDLAGLFRWMHEQAAEQEAKLIDSLPPDRREQLGRLNPAMRRGMVLWLMWQRWRVFRPGGGPPPLDEKQLAEMRSSLTPQTRARLERMTPVEQWQTVGGWIREAVRRRFTSRGRHSGLVPLVDDEALADFFENELSDQQRDHLLNLPGEDMQRELQRMYLMRLSVVEPGSIFPGGGRPGRPPGFPPSPGRGPHRSPHGHPGGPSAGPGPPGTSPPGAPGGRPPGPPTSPLPPRRESPRPGPPREPPAGPAADSTAPGVSPSDGNREPG